MFRGEASNGEAPPLRLNAINRTIMNISCRTGVSKSLDNKWPFLLGIVAAADRYPKKNRKKKDY